MNESGRGGNTIKLHLKFNHDHDSHGTSIITLQCHTNNIIMLQICMFDIVSII